MWLCYQLPFSTLQRLEKSDWAEHQMPVAVASSDVGVYASFVLCRSRSPFIFHFFAGGGRGTFGSQKEGSDGKGLLARTLCLFPSCGVRLKTLQSLLDLLPCSNVIGYECTNECIVNKGTSSSSTCTYSRLFRSKPNRKMAIMPWDGKPLTRASGVPT